MANLTVIAQISNNVPFLWGEETPDLLQEVNNFVRCCENILDCFGEETDKQTFIKFIPTKLRGRAARLLEGIECRGFNDIKSALYNKLVNTKPYIIQLNELRLCKQYPNETVKCFGERINAMLKLCKQKAREKHTGDITLIEADLEETAVFAFKAGLFNPTYRLLIWQDTENNLTKLISKLNQIEESENQISNFNSPLGFNYSSSNLNNSPSNFQASQYYAANLNQNLSQFPPNPYQVTPNGAHDHNSTFLTHSNPTNSQNFNTQNSFQQGKQKPSKSENQEKILQKFKCGFCGKPNHNYAECRTRKATPFCTSCKMYGHNVLVCPTTQNNRAINTVQKKKTHINQLKCDFCQRRGHTVENCFARQTWEAKCNKSTQKGNFKWAATHEQAN